MRPENISGTHHEWQKYVSVIKRRNYFIDPNVSMGGDAPKDFIKVYSYGTVRRRNRHKWTAYIAKVGHKWYPVESITEHLLNRIGQELGFTMAHSKIVIIGNQLRFLSEYFLKPATEELVHGADIYAGYLSDENKDFVHEVEAQKIAQTFFTFQFAENALRQMFPKYADTLLFGLVKILLFDAMIGNNDRHFYNWGIVRNISGTKPPTFAPIYDTARGLFWNDSDAKIEEKARSYRKNKSTLDKYINGAKPKTGWDGDESINHFQLVAHLCSSRQHYKDFLAKIIQEPQEEKVFAMIDGEFGRLMTANRLFLIKECLKSRFEILRTIASA